MSTIDADSAAGSGQRRSKWVMPGLQWKVILAALAVGVLVVLGNVVFMYVSLLEFKIPPSESPIELLERFRHIIHSCALLSVCTAIPLSVLLGIFLSFRFCGPIYRLRKFLGELESGPWDRSCHFRDGDDLGDLREAANRAVGLMGEQILIRHRLLDELRELVEAHADALSGDERARELLERTRAMAEGLGERFNAGALRPVRRTEEKVSG